MKTYKITFEVDLPDSTNIPGWLHMFRLLFKDWKNITMVKRRKVNDVVLGQDDGGSK